MSSPHTHRWWTPLARGTRCTAACCTWIGVCTAAHVPRGMPQHRALWCVLFGVRPCRGRCSVEALRVLEAAAKENRGCCPAGLSIGVSILLPLGNGVVVDRRFWICARPRAFLGRRLWFFCAGMHSFYRRPVESCCNKPSAVRPQAAPALAWAGRHFVTCDSFGH